MSDVKCTLSEGEASVIDYSEGCRLILGMLDSCVIYAGRSGITVVSFSTLCASAFIILANNGGVA